MAPVKRIMPLLGVVVTVLLTAGCAASFNSRGLNLVAEANYSQVVKEFEPKDANLSGMPFEQLLYLCSSYAELKNYRKLFPCLDVAQAKVDRGDFIADTWNHSATPARMKNIAYLELGQYDDAIKAGEYSARVIEEKDLKGYDKIKTLENLGLAYALAGKSDKATAVAKELADMYMGYPNMLLKDDQNVALGKIYIALQRYQDAIDRLSYKFENSNTFLKTISGWDVFTNNKITFEFMKNKCLFEVGRLAEAKQGYDELLRYAYIRDRGEMYWNILYDRGRIAEKENDLPAAATFYEKAVDVIEEQRSTINTEASKIGFAGDKQAVYQRLIAVLYQTGQFEKAFVSVERSKSRALVDLLASKNDFAVKTGDGQQVRAILDSRDRSEAALLAMDKSLDKSGSRGIAVKAKGELQTSAPELSSLVTVTASSVAAIRTSLPDRETLLEYYYFGNEIYAFVISSDGLQCVKLNGDGLVADVEAFRQSLESAAATRYRELGQKLYQRLFKPLEGALKQKSLVIVPHGVLHYLPMNALFDGNGYLIDRYQIRLMPSASAITFLREKKADKNGGILAFGNPDLGDPRLDLAFAQKEAVAVAATRPNSKIFLRKDATEEVLRRYGNSFTYIHFATHGQFNPDAPLQSALLLAPNGQASGMMTVDKLYAMQLDVNLVTLSACETGLSKVANGDDLVGLTRGFLYAGSSSIVASLWKVDDLATSLLMTTFYQELRKTDKREALRTAQLKTRKKYPHPYYWASFQLTGALW
jgi:CHAT domain-containing protein